MKTEASPLTASLLARKGAAMPTPLFAAAPPIPPRVSDPRPVAPGAAAPRAADTLQMPPGAAAPRGLKGRRRITLRLDADRHMRLKLAGAHLGMSLQDIMIAALDAHLVREAPCPCLAQPK